MIQKFYINILLNSNIESPQWTGLLKIISFFFIPMKKEITKINKNSNEGVVTISYKIKGFMVTLLLSLVDNLTEGLHKS